MHRMHLGSSRTPEGGCQVLGEAHGEGRHLVLKLLHNRLKRQHQVLVVNLPNQSRNLSNEYSC